MKTLGILGLSVVFLMGFAAYAGAIPSLQLDIGGGTYLPNNDPIDPGTIVAGSDLFTLYAYLMPNGTNHVGDAFYLSAAVIPSLPMTNPPPDLGSFTFEVDGQTRTIEVTANMLYGAPPLSGVDGGDLQTHGIFQTYFLEFQVSFSGAPQIAPYDTQTRAINGGTIPTSGTGMYYRAFEVDTSGLNAGYFIHFDLYNAVITNQDYAGDIDLVKASAKAPFSHDAQSNGHQVPEPSTLLLLGFGLAGVGLYRRMKG